MQIGSYALKSPYILAPMAGITDLPFRKICRTMGAGLAVSEMVHANPELWHTEKSAHRKINDGEEGPISIQLLGNDPKMMALAAKHNVENGADIIDINMGCPAKKVCKKAAGSALMQDEKLVEEILIAIVEAVSVPVTLKIRTGWSEEHKNAVTIAQLAESVGISALAVHGRTREQKFSGEAEYETIRRVKESVSIPVIANGDICSFEKAEAVLRETGADAVMIGRAALGNPWIFKELTSGRSYRPTLEEVSEVVEEHLKALHHFYKESAIRISRKHLVWYLEPYLNDRAARISLLAAESEAEQLHWIERILSSAMDAGLAE